MLDWTTLVQFGSEQSWNVSFPALASASTYDAWSCGVALFVRSASAGETSAGTSGTIDAAGCVIDAMPSFTVIEAIRFELPPPAYATVWWRQYWT